MMVIYIDINTNQRFKQTLKYVLDFINVSSSEKRKVYSAIAECMSKASDVFLKANAVAQVY